MKTIKVVCGIIWKEGRVLIARRKPEKSLGGYWEFPGGKIETNEDPLAALERELYEEMGMVVSDTTYYDTHTYNYNSFTIELIGYECKFQKASFALKDHDEYVFVDVESIKNYTLAPADECFVIRLLKKKVSKN